MTRPVRGWLILAATTVLVGCGEAERPRFVPANPDAPEASAGGRSPADGSARGGAIPKNIPMH